MEATAQAATITIINNDAAGEGFKLAMRTLDVFRTSVAAAALGFARRALSEGLQRATTRPMQAAAT